MPFSKVFPNFESPFILLLNTINNSHVHTLTAVTFWLCRVSNLFMWIFLQFLPPSVAGSRTLKGWKSPVWCKLLPSQGVEAKLLLVSCLKGRGAVRFAVLGVWPFSPVIGRRWWRRRLASLADARHHTSWPHCFSSAVKTAAAPLSLASAPFLSTPLDFQSLTFSLLSQASWRFPS